MSALSINKQREQSVRSIRTTADTEKVRAVFTAWRDRSADEAKARDYRAASLMRKGLDAWLALHKRELKAANMVASYHRHIIKACMSIWRSATTRAVALSSLETQFTTQRNRSIVSTALLTWSDKARVQAFHTWHRQLRALHAIDSLRAHVTLARTLEQRAIECDGARIHRILRNVFWKWRDATSVHTNEREMKMQSFLAQTVHRVTWQVIRAWRDVAHDEGENSTQNIDTIQSSINRQLLASAFTAWQTAVRTQKEAAEDEKITHFQAARDHKSARLLLLLWQAQARTIITARLHHQFSLMRAVWMQWKRALVQRTELMRKRFVQRIENHLVHILSDIIVSDFIIVIIIMCLCSPQAAGTIGCSNACSGAVETSITVHTPSCCEVCSHMATERDVIVNSPQALSPLSMVQLDPVSRVQ